MDLKLNITFFCINQNYYKKFIVYKEVVMHYKYTRLLSLYFYNNNLM